MPPHGFLGFAGQEFSLEQEVAGTGSSLRDHLLSQWRQEGFREDAKPIELEQEECPEELRYLWDYFRRMGIRRTRTDQGHWNPIPHEGVRAWAEARHFRLLPFEHDILDSLEYIYLQIRNAPKKGN